MDDKQTKAMNRLLKRLSALRKTLRKDERDLLDSLVVRSSSEVRGHADLSAADHSAADHGGADHSAADHSSADHSAADTAQADWDILLSKDGYKL